MEKELILEIGTEEIPALFLEKAREDLGNILSGELRDKGIEFEEMEIFYTPRRLSARVSGLERKQRDRTTENFGPPKRIAFDEDGKPTKAAAGFARSQKVDVEELVIAKRDNGEFLCVRKTVKGKKTSSVLKEILPGVISSVPFRKSMRWGDGKLAFARPIRWIAALYDGKPVKFSVENIKSSDRSFGHRFTSPKPFRVTSWANYLKTLEKNNVVADPEKRKKIIRRDTEAAAKKIGGTIKEDPELLETVVNLVEHPTVLVGKFEEKYLRLPEEVLISVMKNHQKYFPVYSEKTGKLLPCFIFVCGTPVKDKQVIIRGNERVIRARLNDAEFFFSEDTKKNLSAYTEELESMMFLSDIGTYREKVERMRMLAADIFASPDLERAAELSKSDLATQMVFEFAELQGVMGKYYSLASKEKKAVANAIEEQYMPLTRTGELPRTKTGALLSIVDKTDNICSSFIAGLAPTGSSDPYALRRQTLGIIRIAIEKKLDISLSTLLERGIRLVLDSMDAQKARDGKLSEEELKVNILAFFSERFRNLMTESGYERNVVESVISAGFDNPLDAYRRINALGKFAKRKDFEALATGFKRVFNIAKTRPSSQLDKKLFKQKEEKDLHRAFTKTQTAVLKKLADPEKAAGQSDYLKALESIKTLSAPIDRFFDAVMVMDKNKKIRDNRLALLNEIKDLFFMIADFSKI
ncbi:MAG: glycine--tRNA ligase subunit beta [Candidatus Dadabacteria bacterium]|nr:glycine--tRNA ligase subunit beta [Candidatus Dadabacteria bacterium]